MTKQPYGRLRTLWKPGRKQWICVFWAGLAILCLALLLPPRSLPVPPPLGLSDKFQHAAGFFALMTVGCFAYRMPPGEFRLAACLGILGIVLEVAQAAVPGRNASIEDAAANVVGVVAAVLAARLVSTLQARSTPEERSPSENRPG